MQSEEIPDLVGELRHDFYKSRVRAFEFNFDREDVIPQREVLSEHFLLAAVDAARQAGSPKDYVHAATVLALRSTSHQEGFAGRTFLERLLAYAERIGYGSNYKEEEDLRKLKIHLESLPDISD